MLSHADLAMDDIGAFAQQQDSSDMQELLPRLPMEQQQHQQLWQQLSGRPGMQPMPQTAHGIPTHEAQLHSGVQAQFGTCVNSGWQSRTSYLQRSSTQLCLVNLVLWKRKRHVLVQVLPWPCARLHQHGSHNHACSYHNQLCSLSMNVTTPILGIIR